MLSAYANASLLFSASAELLLVLFTILIVGRATRRKAAAAELEAKAS